MKLELTGKRFGKWTVLEYAGMADKSRDSMWLCRCDCGREYKTKGYYLTNGHSTQCQYCGTHSKTDYPSDEVPVSIWNRILRNASKRDIEINISRQEAYDLFLSQKGLCKLSKLNISFPKNGTQFLNEGCDASLDRIDSSKGYLKGNVQWVHKDINLMKNVLASERFLSLCKLVTENL